MLVGNKLSTSQRHAGPIRKSYITHYLSEILKSSLSRTILKHSLETVAGRVTVYTSAFSDSMGTMATVVFGGKRWDRRNLSVSIASLFALELQTDHQASHHTPVSTTELSVGLGGYIKLWSAAVCLCYITSVIAAHACLHMYFFILVHPLTHDILFVFQTRMSVKMVLMTVPAEAWPARTWLVHTCASVPLDTHGSPAGTVAWVR